MRKLEKMNARRTEIARQFQAVLSEVEEIQLPPESNNCKHAWQLYVLRLNLETLTINRAQFLDEMKQRGIGCSVHFIPIPLHPYYGRVLAMRDPCTRALLEYPRLLSIPIYSTMSDDDVDRVVDAVKDIAAKHRVKKSVPVCLAASVGATG